MMYSDRGRSGLTQSSARQISALQAANCFMPVPSAVSIVDLPQRLIRANQQLPSALPIFWAPGAPAFHSKTRPDVSKHNITRSYAVTSTQAVPPRTGGSLGGSTTSVGVASRPELVATIEIATVANAVGLGASAMLPFCRRMRCQPAGTYSSYCNRCSSPLRSPDPATPCLAIHEL